MMSYYRMNCNIKRLQRISKVRLCISGAIKYNCFFFPENNYLPLLLDTDPRLLVSLPRALLRFLSFSLDFTDVGDSERTRFALNR